MAISAALIFRMARDFTPRSRTCPAVAESNTKGIMISTVLMAVSTSDPNPKSSRLFIVSKTMSPCLNRLSLNPVRNATQKSGQKLRRVINCIWDIDHSWSPGVGERLPRWLLELLLSGHSARTTTACLARDRRS